MTQHIPSATRSPQKKRERKLFCKPGPAVFSPCHGICGDSFIAADFLGVTFFSSKLQRVNFHRKTLAGLKARTAVQETGVPGASPTTHALPLVCFLKTSLGFLSMSPERKAYFSNWIFSPWVSSPCGYGIQVVARIPESPSAECQSWSKGGRWPRK